jgi:hypothetical protein
MEGLRGQRYPDGSLFNSKQLDLLLVNKQRGIAGGWWLRAAVKAAAFVVGGFALSNR